MDTTEEILRRYQEANDNVRLELFMNYRELRTSFREIDRSTDVVVPIRSQPKTEFRWEEMFACCWKRLAAVVGGR